LRAPVRPGRVQIAADDYEVRRKTAGERVLTVRIEAAVSVVGPGVENVHEEVAAGVADRVPIGGVEVTGGAVTRLGLCAEARVVGGRRRRVGACLYACGGRRKGAEESGKSALQSALLAADHGQRV